MRHRISAALAVLIAVTGFAGTAHAAPEMEADKNVSLISASNETATVAVKDAGPSRECFFTLIGFDPTTAVGRIWYATILEALSTGAKVDLAYERSGNNCQLTQVVMH